MGRPELGCSWKEDTMVRHDARPQIKVSLLGFQSLAKTWSHRCISCMPPSAIVSGSGQKITTTRHVGQMAPSPAAVLRSSPIQFFPFSLVSCKEIRFSSQLLRAFQKIYKVVTVSPSPPQTSLSTLQQSFKTSPWEASNIMHVPNRKLHLIREIRNR